VLAALAPHVTCDRLVDYWFSRDAHVDCELLAELGKLRERGFAIHLATVQEHERAHYLWESVGLREHADAMHYSAELGVVKPELGFYRAIERRTGFASGEILFIDDRADNVEGARAAGWRSALWTPEARLVDVITMADFA
jgi:putative hydrolase of the HAD superfamily